MAAANSFLRAQVFAEKHESAVVLAGSAFGALVIFALNYFYIFPAIGNEILYNIINLLAITTLGVPYAMLEYNIYLSTKEIEERFPDFLRDVTEGLRGGMTLPLSIKYASNNNYGSLNKYVKRLVAQITWGVPFETSLHQFSQNLKSPTISRAVSTIIEAHRSGGNIAEALEAVGKSSVEIEKLRSERASRISSQMMSGYVIFFIFIAIMAGMREFLLPALSWGAVTSSGEEIMEASKTAINVEVYGTMFSHLAIIQGIFSGIVIGKLSEGTISAGAKHAAILAFVGYLALVGAHGLFGGGVAVTP